MVVIGDFDPDELEMIKNDYAFYIKYSGFTSVDIKTIIERIRCISCHSKLLIHNHGIDFILIRNDDSIVATVKIDTLKFDKFVYNEDFMINIDLMKFYKYICIHTFDDEITLYSKNENTSKLILINENKQKQRWINDIITFEQN
jgi:hypothetical protein